MKTYQYYALLIPVLAFCLRLGSPETAGLSYLVLAILAISGRKQAIMALALSWLFTMWTPGFGPPAQFASAGRYLVILTASASLLARGQDFQNWIASRSEQPLKMVTIALAMYLVIHSILLSPIPDVSLLKAGSWAILVIALMVGWYNIGYSGARKLEHWLVLFLMLLLIFSLPLIGLPTGYLRNGSGFQGLLNHPQVFGPAMALLAAMLIPRQLSVPKPRLWVSAALIIAIILIFLSAARTALLALIFATVAGFILTILIAKKGMISAMLGRFSPFFLIVLSLLAVTSVLFGIDYAQTFNSFIVKRGGFNVVTIYDSYLQSRSSLLDPIIANIRDNWLFGIGFGLPSIDSYGEIARDPLLGLPLALPLEKGNLILSALEELGVVGFTLFIAWILLLIESSARRGLGNLIVIFTILFLNLGEANLFSPGGFGVLSLILLGWASSSPLEAKFVLSDSHAAQSISQS